MTSTAAPVSDPRPAWRRPIAFPTLPAPADLRALGGLAALVAALCWPVIAQGRVYWERDVHLYLYPRAEAFVRVLTQGSLPLWNPYGAFGEPLLANPFMQVFYPPTWLHLVMRPWTWYAGFVVAHLFFTAAGAHLLARRLGTSPTGAFLTAAAWITSGPLLSLVSLSHHFTGAAWIPWVVASSDYAFATRRARHVLAAGAVLALQILAGSADMCALALVLAAANALRHVDWTALRGGQNRRLVLSGALALVLGLGLSAAQWVPTLELATRSSRSGLPERIRTYWSVHPAALAQAVLPVPLHALPLSTEVRAALFESREPFLVSLYLGLAAGILVLAAVVERPLARAIALLLGLIVLLALGRHTPVFGLVTTLIPPLRVLRYPVKVMVPAALLWSVLAGMGLDALRQTGRGRSRVAILAMAVLPVGLAASLGIAATRWPEALGAYLQRSALDPPFSVVVLPAARQVLLAAGLAAGVAALATLAARRRWAGPALSLLVILDLFLANHGLNLTCAPELMAWRPPSADFIRETDGGRAYSYDYYVATRGRDSLSHPPYALAAAPADPVMGAVALRGALFPSVLGQWGLESSYDLDQTGLFSREMATLSRFLRLAEGTPTHSRLLRMGAVTRVAAMHTAGFEDLALVATLPTLFQEPLRVYAVPDAVPRAHVVGGVLVADGDAALAALQEASFDPARAVILPTGTPVAAPPRAPGRCRIVSWKPDRIAVEADMDGPGYVVMADTYDPGWRTRVDGRPATLLRADVALRAVEVPAGRHLVESTYRPPAIGLGLAVSAASAIFAAGAWLRRDA